MTRYRPRSPGARLQALRRALWEEDQARFLVSLIRIGDFPLDWQQRFWALETATATRMDAEREFWEARAGHGLD